MPVLTTSASEEESEGTAAFVNQIMERVLGTDDDAIAKVASSPDKCVIGVLDCVMYG